MKSSSQIFGAVVAGVGASLLTRYILSVQQQQQKRASKQLASDSHQRWDGEGGAIIDAVPRPTTP